MNNKKIFLPNKFYSKNITFVCQLECETNLLELYENFTTLEKNIKNQLENVKNIYITYTNTVSTINSKNKINFLEIIFKVIIEYKNQKYFFPIITIVNNPYSFLRGYMLGFNKILDEKMKYYDDKLILNIKGINLKYNISKNIKETNKVFNYINLPFITNIQRNIYNNINDLVTLDIFNFREIYRKNYEINSIMFGNILGVNLNVNCVIKTENTFILNGIKKI